MTCWACHAPTGAPRLLEERMFGTGERFPYVTCTRCGTTQIEAVPTDLERHYPSNYYSFADTAIPGWFHTMDVERLGPALVDLQLGVRPATDPEVRAQFHSLVPRVVQHYLPGLLADPTRRVLDVGCGRGAFVDALAQAGCTAVQGVDPFVQHGSARVVKGNLAQIEGPIDHVLFQHSLEHLADPGAALEQAAARLSADGEIVVRIPLVDNHLVQEHGDAWSSYEPPRHLVLFSEAGFRTLATHAGLRVVEMHREANLWSVLATAQWALGIPIAHHRSALVDPQAADDPFVFVDARHRASRANIENLGDQAMFRLVSLGTLD